MGKSSVLKNLKVYDMIYQRGDFMRKSYSDTAGRLVLLSCFFSVLTIIMYTAQTSSGIGTLTKLVFIIISVVPVALTLLLLALGMIKKNKLLLCLYFSLDGILQVYNFLKQINARGRFEKLANLEMIPLYLSNFLYDAALLCLVIFAFKGKERAKPATAIMLLCGIAKLSQLALVAAFSSASTAFILMKCISCAALAISYILIGIGIKSKSKKLIWCSVVPAAVSTVLEAFLTSRGAACGVTSTVSLILLNVGTAMLIIYMQGQIGLPPKTKKTVSKKRK